MDDLINRLHVRLAAEKAVRETGHNAADREQAELIRLLTEASYALEAARMENKGHRIAIQQLYDRAEQLAETLRAVVADMREWGEPAKGAHVERIQRRLDDALRDHEQEVSNG